MKIVHTEDVSALRAKAYPSQADLADAIYWQARGDNSKMEAYLAKCDAVKVMYPKVTT